VALVRAAAVRHNTTDEGTCTLLAVSVEAHVRCTHLVLSLWVVQDAGACRIYIYMLDLVELGCEHDAELRVWDGLI
jgi:hypothetical protein